MDDELNQLIEGDNDFDTLLQNVIKDKGGSPEQYRDLLDRIAYHESAGTMDPTIKQYGGGPGRGKYQFEGKEGSNRILTSAIRTKRYYRNIGAEVPEFIQNIINKGTEDATKLTSEQQDILALGDLRMKKGVDLKSYVEGNLPIEDLWADHWWAGQKDKRGAKINSFKNSQSKYNQINKIINTPKPKNFKSSVRETREIPADATQVRTPQLKQFNDVTGRASVTSDDIFRSNFTDFLDSYISGNNSDYINEYGNGGRHEENPHGGIPQGVGSNGRMNTVEEGETSMELSSGKYIFSNRIKL